MKFDSLKNISQSLEIVHGDPDAFEVIGISHSDHPIDHELVFFKTKKYVTSLRSKADGKTFNAGAVVEKKYLESIADEELIYLKETFTWLASIESVDRGMCELSKPFYDLKFADLNLHVDGRQLNLCDIESSAEIAQGVFIGERTKIGKNVTIMPGAVIMPEVTIGDGTVIFPNVTLYPYTRIGERCRIHASTVIGCDGFGYNFYDGAHQKIWHFSGVEILNDVEIGSNTLIDAGAFTPTFIGNGTKIDNLTQISHNVKIHNHVIVCGTTGIAGSAEIFDYCAFGAGAGVAPAAKIGPNAQVAARAVVSENAIVPPGEVYAGHPARPVKDWLRSTATLRKLSNKK